MLFGMKYHDTVEQHQTMSFSSLPSSCRWFDGTPTIIEAIEIGDPS